MVCFRSRFNEKGINDFSYYIIVCPPYRHDKGSSIILSMHDFFSLITKGQLGNYLLYTNMASMIFQNH